MCKFASFVLTKGEEFWSDKSDSHEEIIRENNLHADGAHGPNILRVEISPTNKIKIWPSLKEWTYEVDQDRMPEWFDAQECEKRTRAALARRYKKGFTHPNVIGCTALTEVSLPNATHANVIGCTALTEVSLPNATHAYVSGCTALTEVSLPNATYADVIDCTALTEVSLPNATHPNVRGCNPGLKIITGKNCRIIR